MPAAEKCLLARYSDEPSKKESFLLRYTCIEYFSAVLISGIYDLVPTCIHIHSSNCFADTQKEVDVPYANPHFIRLSRCFDSIVETCSIATIIPK